MTQPPSEDLSALPLTELLSRATSSTDEDVRWDCIREVQRQGAREGFEAALRFARDHDPARRQAGAAILGQIGCSHGRDTFRVESVAALIELLADPEPVVLATAAHGLGHRQDQSAISQLVPLSSHLDPEVRLGVVLGLSGNNDERAISALIALTTDEDRDVRDWATFGLGQQIDADTPEIVVALRGRLSDLDAEIRGEALSGLARRKVPGTAEAIMAEIDRDPASVIAVVLEAAAELGDCALLSRLRSLHASAPKAGNSDYWTILLDDAIRACENRGR